MRALRRLPRRWKRRRQKNFQVDTWREMGKLVRGQFYVDRGGGADDTIFLAGQGRSGTTWISELVNAKGEFRFIDEPFHPGRLHVTERFAPRQYLRPDDRTPELVRSAEAIVTGRVRSLWTDRYNRRPFPRRRLIKEVRGNLLLPWLHARFPQMPMVLLLRHPCAVVTSQFRLAEDWHVDLRRFLRQDALMQDHLEAVRDPLERAAAEGSEFERHVMAWAIDNYVPLRMLTSGGVHVCFYERFCVDPAGETGRLFAFLGLPVDAAATARLREPSATAQKDSAILAGDGIDLVNRWKRDVSVADLDLTLDVLRLFGLDAVYGEGAMPKVEDPVGALSGRGGGAAPQPTRSASDGSAGRGIGSAE